MSIKAVEPTPNSFRSYVAQDIGRGSQPAFGGGNNIPERSALGARRRKTPGIDRWLSTSTRSSEAFTGGVSSDTAPCKERLG